MPVNQTRNFSRYPQIPSGYIDSPRKVCPGVAMHVASWCWRNGVINQINWQRLKHVPSKWAVSVKGMMMWIETGTILDTADAVWLLHIGHQTWACFRGNHRLSTQSGNLAHQASTGLRNWGFEASSRWLAVSFSYCATTMEHSELDPYVPKYVLLSLSSPPPMIFSTRFLRP